MIGRTNACGATVRLFTPSATISDGVLTIRDRNGDFCSGFKVVTEFDETFYLEDGENELSLYDNFFETTKLYVFSLSNILRTSKAFSITYYYEGE